MVANSDANGNLKVVVTSKSNPEVSKHEPMKMESNNMLKENLEAPHVNEAAVTNMGEKNSDFMQSKNAVVKGSGRPKNVPSKQTDEKKQGGQSQMSRPILEENLVLGVALEGSKRTLPIEEGMDSSSAREAKEMAAQGRNRPLKAENGEDK